MDCTNGGNLSGRSYQYTFSDAGGGSYAELGCGPYAGIQLYYQSYPGGPYYTTSNTIALGTASKTQAGTWNGYHRAFVHYSSGTYFQVGYVSS